METLESDAGIPVQRISAAELPDFISSYRRQVQAYEQRYELASETMAELVDDEAIIPTMDIIEWYHAHSTLKFLLDAASAMGSPGTSGARQSQAHLPDHLTSPPLP